MTVIEKIKNEIIEVLIENENCVLTGFKSFDKFSTLSTGQREWTVITPDGQNTNIILLTDVNSECIEAFNDLKSSKIIKFEKCSSLLAQTEGADYDLPVATSFRKYKNLRWLPTLVCRGDKWQER